MILRPDIYDHNNPIYPIVDINSIKGGTHVLPYSTVREEGGIETYSTRFEIPQRHLIEGMDVIERIVHLDPKVWVRWKLIDIDLHAEEAGWELLKYGKLYTLVAGDNAEGANIVLEDNEDITSLVELLEHSILSTTTKNILIDRVTDESKIQIYHALVSDDNVAYADLDYDTDPATVLSTLSILGDEAGHIKSVTAVSRLMILGDLNDVTVITPTVQDVIYWDGSKWVNGPLSDIIEPGEFDTYMVKVSDAGDTPGFLDGKISSGPEIALAGDATDPANLKVKILNTGPFTKITGWEEFTITSNAAGGELTVANRLDITLPSYVSITDGISIATVILLNENFDDPNWTYTATAPFEFEPTKVYVLTEIQERSNSLMQAFYAGEGLVFRSGANQSMLDFQNVASTVNWADDHAAVSAASISADFDSYLYWTIADSISSVNIQTKDVVTFLGTNATTVTLDTDTDTITIDSPVVDGSKWFEDTNLKYLYPKVLDNKVGIGTNTPTTKLHVEDIIHPGSIVLSASKPTGAPVVFSIGHKTDQASTPGFGSALTFLATDDSSSVTQAKIATERGLLDSTAFLLFYTDNVNPNLYTMSMTPSRQVGIGLGYSDIDADARLHIGEGNLRIEGMNPSTSYAQLTAGSMDHPMDILFGDYSGGATSGEADAIFIRTWKNLTGLTNIIAIGGYNEHGLVSFFDTNSVETMHLSPIGLVGIRESTPLFGLDVGVTGRFQGKLRLDDVVNPGADPDKFLVLYDLDQVDPDPDYFNTVGFRTGAEVLGDIGGVPTGRTLQIIGDAKIGVDDETARALTGDLVWNLSWDGGAYDNYSSWTAHVNAIDSWNIGTGDIVNFVEGTGIKLIPSVSGGNLNIKFFADTQGGDDCVEIINNYDDNVLTASGQPCRIIGENNLTFQNGQLQDIRVSTSGTQTAPGVNATITEWYLNVGHTYQPIDTWAESPDNPDFDGLTGVYTAPYADKYHFILDTLVRTDDPELEVYSIATGYRINGSAMQQVQIDENYPPGSVTAQNYEVYIDCFVGDEIEFWQRTDANKDVAAADMVLVSDPVVGTSPEYYVPSIYTVAPIDDYEPAIKNMVLGRIGFSGFYPGRYTQNNYPSAYISATAAEDISTTSTGSTLEFWGSIKNTSTNKLWGMFDYNGKFVINPPSFATVAGYQLDVKGDARITSYTYLDKIDNLGQTPAKFLVAHTLGVPVSFRTASEVLSDIGGAPTGNTVSMTEGSGITITGDTSQALSASPAWTIALDDPYVKIAGDTMTGNLTIPTSPDYTTDNSNDLVAASLGQIKTRVRWKNIWINPSPGYYHQFDMVKEGNWTMMANKETQDHAAPQYEGDPFYLYSGPTPTVVEPSAKQVVYGTKYEWAEEGFIQGYRVYTITGNHYVVWLIDDPGTPEETFTQLFDFTAVSDGWKQFSTEETLVLVGAIWELSVVVNDPEALVVDFSDDWDYQRPNNETIPLAGQIIQANEASGELWVDYNGWETELKNLGIGDTIHALGTDWSIQDVDATPTTYIIFSISPATQVSPTGITTFIFSAVQATPITYMKEPDWWVTAGIPGVDGFFSNTGYDNAIYDKHAYGVDILVQNASISNDWDLVATSAGGAGDSGGGEISIEHIATLNRQALDSHPIEAITDLQTELNKRATIGATPTTDLLYYLLKDDTPEYQWQPVTIGTDITFVEGTATLAHSIYTTTNASATGASVIKSLTTSNGHLTAYTYGTLTLSDIGADNYVKWVISDNVKVGDPLAVTKYDVETTEEVVFIGAGDTTVQLTADRELTIGSIRYTDEEVRDVVSALVTDSDNIEFTYTDNGDATSTLVADLTTTGVTEGDYTLTNFTVDAYGRLTVASSTTGIANNTAGTGAFDGVVLRDYTSASGLITSFTEIDLDSIYVKPSNAKWTELDNKLYPTTIANKVGIGTQSPAAPLEVHGTSFPVGSFKVNVAQTGALTSGFSLRTITSGDMVDGFGGGIVLAIQDENSSTSMASGIVGRIYGVRDGSDTLGKMYFRTTGSNASSTTMTLDSAGNVGIGKEVPTKTLDVDGTLAISGVSTLSGAVTAGSTLNITTAVHAATTVNLLAIDGTRVKHRTVADLKEDMDLATPPTTPTNLALVEYASYVEVAFDGDTTNDYYEIYSSEVSDASGFSMIGKIPQDEIIASMVFADDTYTIKGQIWYKVYAYAHGMVSTPATDTITTTNNVADPTGLTIITDAHHFHVQWDNPKDRRLAYSEVKVEYRDVDSGWDENNATLIYQGLRENVVDYILPQNKDKYIKVWVNSITRT